MIVPATVSSEIVVRIDDLPPGQLDLLKGALCFKNEDREKQEKLKTFGFWDLPETISLWREEKRRGGDHVLCLPRGFAAQLVAGLSGAGATVEWNDQRSAATAVPGYFKPFLLRDYQATFVADLMRAEQGVGMAPTGSGKTTMILGLLALIQQKTIVIVDKEALLEQWRQRANQFLGLSLDLDDERSVGKIGKGVWEERDLTICLRQTMSSRQWQTDAIDWASRWGVTILDEVHHLGTADTLQEVVRSLPSKWMFGVSATPARSETQGLITGALVGPLVATVRRTELVKQGILVQPSVRVIRSDFQADFWGDHDSDADGRCDKPDCKKKTQHSHRNNWPSCLKALVEDKRRNAMIAEMIAAEPDHVHLVPSRQLKHLDLIEKALKAAGYEGPIRKLRGEENARGESTEIAEAMKEAGGGVLLSTVADEGLDVPPLDRVWMVFPIRQQAATIQIVGRVERASPGKNSAVVVDVHDPGCGVFDEQHLERMRTYRLQGLRIERQHDLADVTPLKKPGDSDEGWVDIGMTPSAEDSARRPKIYSKREGADPYPPGAVYVGRPTMWGNQFVVGQHGAQGECAEFYSEWLLGPDGKYIRDQARLQLRGKDLICWCRSPSDTNPAPCHAEALLEVANGDEQVDHIEWWSFPEHNAQWRRHRGCSEPFPWVSPLDDCPPPAPGEMGECAHCSQVLPVVVHPRQPEHLVLITGSRDWTDSRMIARYVRQLYQEALQDDVWLVLMHGGARGADQLVNAPAKRLGIEVRVVEPDWSTGNGAGFARNIEMLDKRPERVGAFSLGTSGTQHAIDQAKARGIPVDLHGHGGLVTA